MFMLTKRIYLAIVPVCLAMTVSGCASFFAAAGNPVIYRFGTDFISPMVAEMVDRADNVDSIQVVREGIGANAMLISVLTELSPNNRLLLKKAAYLFCAYGLLVEDQEPEFASELYAIAKQYGLRALKMNRCFAKGLKKGKRIPELAGCLNGKYKEDALWAGVATGLWVFRNLEDSAALIEIADAVALVERSLELDDDYFFSLGKVFMGAYYAQVPHVFGTGGGPEASARLFAEARAESGGKLLLVDVFEARFLDTQMNNREEFIRKLEHVLAADNNILEGARGFTGIAKLKARYFLDHIEEFF